MVRIRRVAACILIAATAFCSARGTRAADYPPAHHANQPLTLASGDRIYGVHTGITTLSVPAGCTVSLVPYDGVDSRKGMLNLTAASIVIEGALTAAGAGFTGGAGQGSEDSEYCIYYGSHPVSRECTRYTYADGTTPYGGGLFADGHGDGPFPGMPAAEVIRPGGYSCLAANDDDSTGADVWMGGGGGGGPAGSLCGWWMWDVYDGTDEGGGGGGGGRGGGAITLIATESLRIGPGAVVTASGAFGGNAVGGNGGSAEPFQKGVGAAGATNPYHVYSYGCTNHDGGNGGGGAGGGIAILLPAAAGVDIAPGARIRSLGRWVCPEETTTTNGGTVKLFYPDTPPALGDEVVTAGRVLVVPMAFEAESASDFASGALQPPGSYDGWSNFGFSSPSLGWSDHDSTAGALCAHVIADANHYRLSGVRANTGDSLPCTAVGPGKVVRAKFMVYAGGQADPGDPDQIPNARMRLASRFAASSMLEVYTHINGDPQSTALGHDIAPSRDPAKPSVYRVDYNPVDVPYLGTNAQDEVVMRAFEAYSVDPQDNGYLALTESIIGTYPAAVVALAGPPVKTYAATGTDAGDLAGVNPAAERLLYNLIPNPEPGGFGTVEFTGATPACIESGAGVTIDCTAVPVDRIGIASINFNPDRGTNDFAGRVRVEPGKQYMVRFHLTATQQSNRQAHIRMRARSAKWAWNQKFEIGGAWAAGTANNAMAQQMLPGVGCLNPDKTGSEAGGWYTLLFHTPLSADIRPDVEGTLAEKMPNFSAQPGPGADTPSQRDLLIGLDMIDTLTANGLQHLEQGQVTLDRVEVRVHDLVPD